MHLGISAEVFFVREAKIEVREGAGVAAISFYLTLIFLEKAVYRGHLASL